MSKIIEPALGGAALTPMFVGPAAKGALLAYIYTVGHGSEEDKLLKEIYLDKRLTSRIELLTEESHQAIDALDRAVLTKNPVLLFCAESLIEQMGSPEVTAKILQ